MPRKRRAGFVRHRATALTPALTLYLQTGDWSRALDQVKGGESPNAFELYSLAGTALRGDDGQLQTLWAEHRDVVLEAWVRAHPGTRPFSWWIFNAPESRKCVADQGNHLAHLEPAQAEQVWRRGFGIPAIDQIGHFTISFESQAAYLARHELLPAEERARLGREAFEPERIEVDEGGLHEQ